MHYKQQCCKRASPAGLGNDCSHWPSGTEPPATIKQPAAHSPCCCVPHSSDKVTEPAALQSTRGDDDALVTLLIMELNCQDVQASKVYIPNTAAGLQSTPGMGARNYCCSADSRQPICERRPSP